MGRLISTTMIDAKGNPVPSDTSIPDFRRGIKIVRKSLFYKGEVADLGVPRVKWGNVRSKKEEQIRLHQRSGYR